MHPLLERILFPLGCTAPAVLVGIASMRAGQAPNHFPLINASAWLAGASLLALPPAVPKLVRKHTADLAFLAVLLLLPTLLNDGLDGVHRWVMLGPIRLHPSAVLSPLIVLGALRAACSRRSALALGLIAGLQGLHLFQPDAGQSTAVACAVVAACVVPSSSTRSLRASLALIAALACVATWVRPDPLSPVHFVEDALPVAFRAGLPMGLAAAVTLSLPVLGPWIRAWRERKRRIVAGEVALGTYMAASLTVVFAGNFPTPLLGFGGSPILGATAGFVVLAWSAREGPAT